MFFGNFTHTLLAWIWRNQGAQGVWSGFNCIRFIGNTPKVIIHIRTTCFLKHPKIAFLAIFAIFDHLIPQLWAKMANCRQIPRVPKCFPLQSAYNEQPRSRVRWRNSIVTIVWPPLILLLLLRLLLSFIFLLLLPLLLLHLKIRQSNRDKDKLYQTCTNCSLVRS